MSFVPNTDLYRTRVKVINLNETKIKMVGMLESITSPWDYQVLGMDGEVVTVILSDSTDVLVEDDLITLYVI